LIQLPFPFLGSVGLKTMSAEPSSFSFTFVFEAMQALQAGDQHKRQHKLIKLHWVVQLYLLIPTVRFIMEM